MIQRIQTIFLVLAAGAFGALVPLPFATSAVDTQGIFLDGRYSILDNVFLQVLTAAGILLVLVSIFMFKKRHAQLKLGYLVTVIGILIIAVAILFFTNQAPTIAEAEINEGAGLVMPVLAIIFALLANYFIRKDEHLVKSMDRLR